MKIGSLTSDHRKDDERCVKLQWIFACLRVIVEGMGRKPFPSRFCAEIAVQNVSQVHDSDEYHPESRHIMYAKQSEEPVWVEQWNRGVISHNVCHFPYLAAGWKRKKIIGKSVSEQNRKRDRSERSYISPEPELGRFLSIYSTFRRFTFNFRRFNSHLGDSTFKDELVKLSYRPSFARRFFLCLQLSANRLFIGFGLSLP